MVLASPEDLARLADLGYAWRPLGRDLFAGARQPGREGYLDPQYHTHAEMLAELLTLQETYPQICRLYDVGDALSKDYTWTNYSQHYDIWGLRISDNPATDEPEPCIVYDARHHAREPVSTEIVLAVARFFCENYATDPDIRQIVNTTEIWIVPMVNPDGHQWVEEHDPWWRKTLHDHDQDHRVDSSEGIDPNRCYDWHWILDAWYSETYGGPYPWAAPETATMRDLFWLQKPAINPSFHSYGEVVMYPFGYGVQAEPAVREVAVEYANLIGYHPEQSTTANGSSKDWLYGTVGSASFTVETADDFIPSGQTMLYVVEQVLPGSIWLAQRLWGPSIQGRVTDFATGLPVEASIHIPEIHGVYGAGELHDMVTEASTGYYCRVRPAAPQAITLQVSADGYESQTIPVTTGGPSATVRDIQLVPEGMSVEGDAALGGSIDWRFMSPYPAGSSIRLLSRAGEPISAIGIYDTQGRLVRTLLDGPAPSGIVEVGWDGRNDAGGTAGSGIYLVRCAAGKEMFSRRLVLLW